MTKILIAAALMILVFPSRPLLAQLVIEAQAPVQIPNMHVPVEHIAKMDLVSVQSSSIQSIDDLDLAALGNIPTNTDKDAPESNEISVTVTVAAAVVPTPPATNPVSVGGQLSGSALSAYSPANGANPLAQQGGLINDTINASLITGIGEQNITGNIGGVDFAPIMVMDSFSASGKPNFFSE